MDCSHRLPDFNPRSSCEERRGLACGDCAHHQISIHAPHARSDYRWYCKRFRDDNFNPRSSCEERQNTSTARIVDARFQSTLLMRGATELAELDYIAGIFQSTLLMRGATANGRTSRSGATYFNPRSSCEERPPKSAASSRQTGFQSTLLMRGATTKAKVTAYSEMTISIHAPHARSDASRIAK